MKALVRVEALVDATEPFDTLANFVGGKQTGRRRTGEDLMSAALSWEGRFPGYRKEVDRDFEYHAGRIAYFYDKYRRRLPVEALEVLETKEPPGHVYLHDGHHRLCGAMLAGRARILIDWKGEDPALLRAMQVY